MDKIKITIEDLPPQLREIADEIGLESTLLLVKAKGGHVIWNGPNPSPDVVEAIGLEAARKFTDLFRGFPIELNTLESARASATSKAVAELVAQGVNATRIYKRLGLTRNQARYHIKRGLSQLQAKGKDTDQISLPLAL
jgi:DNA-binding CsgD family transcriptional regulator